MAFLADISGVVTVALINPGPIPALGPEVELTLPAGNWQVRCDGIVLFSIGGNGLNADFADSIYPEMAQFIIHAPITSVLTMALASVGNARVSFYPEAGR